MFFPSQQARQSSRQAGKQGLQLSAQWAKHSRNDATMTQTLTGGPRLRSAITLANRSWGNVVAAGSRVLNSGHTMWFLFMSSSSVLISWRLFPSQLGAWRITPGLGESGHLTCTDMGGRHEFQTVCKRFSTGHTSHHHVCRLPFSQVLPWLQKSKPCFRSYETRHMDTPLLCPHHNVFLSSYFHLASLILHALAQPCSLCLPTLSMWGATQYSS